jgi:hypothetical protein
VPTPLGIGMSLSEPDTGAGRAPPLRCYRLRHLIQIRWTESKSVRWALVTPRQCATRGGSVLSPLSPCDIGEY